jgi:outer membrane protein TolC
MVTFLPRILVSLISFALLTVVTPAAAQSPAVSPPRADGTRQLTVDEAVALALEHNLGIHTTRFTPQIEDLGVAQALAAWQPTVNSTVLATSTDMPNTSFLSGATGAKTSDGRFNTNLGVSQALPWGGNYSIGWDSSRSTTTNIFSNFSPQLRSSLALNYRQPLLRGFSIDTARQQVLVSRVNRDIADVTLREAVATTERTVRHAYWELLYALATLEVQGQSLELANQSLRDTQARINIGTAAPVDAIEGEAEVARREEAVIIARSEIASAEDRLRALIFDPTMPDFWTIRIEPISRPERVALQVDTDAAVRNALAGRTDLQQTAKALETVDINMRYFRNQTLPDVTASVDYGVTGLGGTQFVRGAGFPGPVIGQNERSFGSVVRDLFVNDFPTWTASLQVSYPLGTTPEEAGLARARLQHTQSQARLRDQQLQAVTQVRQVARQVITNQQRIDTTRVAREAAERRLQAEERKLTAGTTTSFFVFQAQRDLAQARATELLALLDYNRSLVDFETVQETPLR